MLVGLLSGWHGAGVLRAKQPTLREPAIAQSAHVVRSALRCTCRLSRNGGLRDRYASDGNWELGAGIRVPCLRRRQPYPTCTHLPSRTLALPLPCCHPRFSPCHCHLFVLSGSPLSTSCNVLPTPHRGCLAPKAPPPRTTCSLRLPPSAAASVGVVGVWAQRLVLLFTGSLCRGGGRRCCPRARAVGHAWALLQPCRPLAAERGQPADSRPSYGGLVGVPTLHGHVRVNRRGRRSIACRLGLCLER